jgi:hypothetical protein
MPWALKGFERAKQMAHRSREAVKLPHDDTIKTTAVRIGHQPVELRTLFVCAGDPDIDVLAGVINKKDEANFEKNARKELEDQLYNNLEDELASAALTFDELVPLLRERKAAG